MKLKHTLILTGLASGLLVSNVSAQAAPELVAEPDHCVAGGVGIIPDDDITADDDGTAGDDVAVEKPEVTDPGDATEPDVIKVEDPAVEPPKCEGVPIDWVKRGDGSEEDNPVIYYTMGAGGPLNATGGEEIASALCLSRTQIYLARHRVGRVVKREIARLRKELE